MMRRKFLGCLTLIVASWWLGPQLGITSTEDPLREQIDTNYQAFQSQLQSLLASRKGKFALMRNGEIVEFFDTAIDAYKTGQKLFPQDGLFSIQEVTETPVDLGFFSHAVHQR